MNQSNVICIHLGEYRSRVFTGDLPEGFLQLDDNTSQHNTSPNPPGNVQQHQAMYQSNVPMQVVTRIKVTVAQVWQSYEGCYFFLGPHGWERKFSINIWVI